VNEPRKTFRDAACVVLVGADHPLATSALPAIRRTRSVLFAGTERTMGWDIVDTGFQIVLSGSVPDLARGPFSDAVRAFLADHDLDPQAVASWIAHPGGPAVIDAIEQGLGLGQPVGEFAQRRGPQGIDPHPGVVFGVRLFDDARLAQGAFHDVARTEFFACYAQVDCLVGIAQRGTACDNTKRDMPVTMSSVSPSASAARSGLAPCALKGSTATQKPSSARAARESGW